MMKKLLSALLALGLLTACSKGEKAKGMNITGDWQLTSILVKSVSFGSETVDVYLHFGADHKFELYQMLGTGRFRKFSGNWDLNADLLSGTYSDGKKWGADYIVSVNEDTLRLISQSSTPETDTYKRTTIPQDVIDTVEE